jgi:hypothetical protein
MNSDQFPLISTIIQLIVLQMVILDSMRGSGGEMIVFYVAMTDFVFVTVPK